MDFVSRNRGFNSKIVRSSTKYSRIAEKLPHRKVKRKVNFDDFESFLPRRDWKLTKEIRLIFLEWNDVKLSETFPRFYCNFNIRKHFNWFLSHFRLLDASIFIATNASENQLETLWIYRDWKPHCYCRMTLLFYCCKIVLMMLLWSKIIDYFYSDLVTCNGLSGHFERIYVQNITLLRQW